MQEVVKQIEISDEARKFIENVRSEIREVEGGREYYQGAVDALAYVWAGMPLNAQELYAAGMSQWSDLMGEIGR